MASEPDRPIEGQLDVWDCIEIAKTDGHGSQTAKHADDPVPALGQAPKPLTPAEVVARRLKGPT